LLITEELVSVSPQPSHHHLGQTGSVGILGYHRVRAVHFEGKLIVLFDLALACADVKMFLKRANKNPRAPNFFFGLDPADLLALKNQ
jgi:hypothetical protein